MSPREEYPEPAIIAAPARGTGLLHWVALLLAPAAGPAWWHYRLPGPWWAPSAVMLAVALLGRATRGLLVAACWVWLPGRACLLGLVALAAGVVAWRVGGLYGRVTVCVLAALCGAVFAAPRLRRVHNTERVNTLADPGWAGRVEGEWPDIARAAGLVGPGESGVVAPLLEPPAEPSPGALELRIGLAQVHKFPQDVRTAAPTLARRLRAPEIRVRSGSADGADVALVRAYRRHPMDVMVSWRDLPGVDDPTREWIPVGVDEWDLSAIVRWRIPWLISGAQDSGKTGLIRSGLAGLFATGVPTELWVLDNRADFVDLRPIVHRYAADWASGLSLLRDFNTGLDDRIQSTGPAAGQPGYEHQPRFGDPARLLIVGELTSAMRGPLGKSKIAGEWRAEGPQILSRVAADGRAMSYGLWTTAQVSTKQGVLEEIRDLLSQKACCRIESDSLINPSLGSGAEEAGADPHNIPPVLNGVAMLRDPITKAPTYFRSGWIPPRDTRPALIDPYRRLMGRHLTVIEGEAAN